MIFAENTPNNTGVTICGDFMDFENLYDALHQVVGHDEEYAGYDGSRTRVLGLCYDLRHALMGNRGYLFVPNGLDDDKKRRMEVMAPDKSMYLTIQVLWPEMLFVMIALNDFLKHYAKKHVKNTYIYDLYSDPKVSWDSTIAHVRILQAAVAECLQQTITKAAHTRLMNAMNGRFVSTYRYITQYVDLLNEKFIHMNAEKRLKNISVFAKRISQPDQEYDDLKDDLMDEARRLNCDVDELQLVLDFPDEIEW